MGCCLGCTKDSDSVPQRPLDHRVFLDRPSTRRSAQRTWDSAIKGGGREIVRFYSVEDLRDYDSAPPTGAEPPIGVLVLNELFLWWHSFPAPGVPDQPITPASRRSNRNNHFGRNGAGMSTIIGYGMIEEVGLMCYEDGGCAVRITTKDTEEFPTHSLIIRITEFQQVPSWEVSSIPEEEVLGSLSSEQWHQALVNALDRVLKSYTWAHHFLHCALRQRDLFAHSGIELPELSMLPNEEISQCFSNILNFGASQEDLVGHLIVTNCRVVWALDRDRTTYNVSVPHRAHVPALVDTQTFGLCMVLYIRQPFMSNSEHVGGMRLGFGAANLKGVERKERLEKILAHIQTVQGQYIQNPKYGVADYMLNRRQYQVESHVRLLHALSRLDMLSDDMRPPDIFERQLQGEVCECVICLDQVCNVPPLAYLLAAGRLGWACRHIFHLSCAQQLQTRKCPVCRTSFSEVREMPDIRRNPGAWFDAMDVDRTGDLDIDEVLGALSVVLPIDRDKLEDLLRPCPKEGVCQLNTSSGDAHTPRIVELGEHEEECNVATNESQSAVGCDDPEVEAEGHVPSITATKSVLWSSWDKQGTGRITRQAFEDPEGGLLVWILARLKLVHRGDRPKPCLAAAASQETLGKWFDFWDWSQVGFLTKGQIVRAVAQEFEGRIPDLKSVEVVQTVWQEQMEANMLKPVSPPSGILPNEHIPDEEPGSPGAGSNHNSDARADPWHLREGICSRGDFLEGLGFSLRVKLLEVTNKNAAAGRQRKMSTDLSKLFSFEEALAIAGDGTTSRMSLCLADCATIKRPPGEPEPANPWNGTRSVSATDDIIRGLQRDVQPQTAAIHGNSL